MIHGLDSTSSRQMPGIAKNRPARILSSGSLCLRLLTLALVAAMILAANAGAETVESPPTGPTPTEPAPGAEAPAPPVEPPPAPTGPAPGAEAPAPAPTGPAPGAEAPAPPSETPPAEPPHETPGSGLSVSDQAGNAVPAAEPPEAALGPAASVALPAAPVNAESGGQPVLGRTELAPVNAASLSKSEPSEHGTVASTVRADSESFGCGLNMMGGPSIGKCSPGWDAGGTVPRAADPVAMLALAASLARATIDGPNGGGRGGSADRSPPENPAPSQAPSGAAGGAAVGGASSAPSAFLTLMALLLLAAPHVIRRLRLSCEQWLTAFFVLIPERPG